MSADPDRQDQSEEIRLQSFRIATLTEQLARLRVLVTTWPAALLVAVVLFTPIYEARADDTAPPKPSELVSLTALPGKAADSDNTFIQVLAIVTLLALIAALAACVAMAVGKNRRAGTAGVAAAGAAIVAWAVLSLAVGSSEGGGTIGELGYENTVRILLVPIAATLAIVAGLVTRDESNP